jgi:hypothetical protein
MAVGPTDSLKLTFQVVEEDGLKGVQPLQTFLRFYDPETKEEGIQPLRVTPAGKSKFELVRPLASSKSTRLKTRDRTWPSRLCPFRQQPPHLCK